VVYRRKTPLKTRNLLTALLVVVLLVAYYLMGTGYLKQRREHAALAFQLTDTTRALALIPNPPGDLEARLTAARDSREKVKDMLPGQMSSTSIVNTILKLADDGKVKAIPLITQPWTTVNMGGYECSVFRLSVTVTGTFPQLVSFVNQLENGELKTLIVEDISVYRATGTSGGITPGKTAPVNASLNLAIYTQPQPPARGKGAS
jgi:hypothetical protein